MAVTGSTEQLQQGVVYLMKIYSSLQEVYVDKITDTSYKFRKERVDGTWYLDWVTKKEFHLHHEVIEYLRKPTFAPPIKSEEYSLTINDPTHLANMIEYTKECPVCGGNGRVPDDRITSGESSCPKCLGSGRVWK